MTDHINTLGDVIVQAKKTIADEDMVYNYTLFGDPALRIQTPENRIKLSALDSSTRLVIQGEYDNITVADGDLELLDKDGKILIKQNIAMQNGHFKSSIETGALSYKEIKYIRCFLKDTKSHSDIFGWLTISQDLLKSTKLSSRSI